MTLQSLNDPRSAKWVLVDVLFQPTVRDDVGSLNGQPTPSIVFKSECMWNFGMQL